MTIKDIWKYCGDETVMIDGKKYTIKVTLPSIAAHHTTDSTMQPTLPAVEVTPKAKSHSRTVSNTGPQVDDDDQLLPKDSDINNNPPIIDVTPQRGTRMPNVDENSPPNVAVVDGNIFGNFIVKGNGASTVMQDQGIFRSKYKNLQQTSYFKKTQTAVREMMAEGYEKIIFVFEVPGFRPPAKQATSDERVRRSEEAMKKLMDEFVVDGIAQVSKTGFSSTCSAAITLEPSTIALLIELIRGCFKGAAGKCEFLFVPGEADATLGRLFLDRLIKLGITNDGDSGTNDLMYIEKVIGKEFVSFTQVMWLLLFKTKIPHIKNSTNFTDEQIGDLLKFLSSEPNANRTVPSPFNSSVFSGDRMRFGFRLFCSICGSDYSCSINSIGVKTASNIWRRALLKHHATAKNTLSEDGATGKCSDHLLFMNVMTLLNDEDMLPNDEIFSSKNNFLARQLREFVERSSYKLPPKKDFDFDWFEERVLPNAGRGIGFGNAGRGGAGRGGAGRGGAGRGGAGRGGAGRGGAGRGGAGRGGAGAQQNFRPTNKSRSIFFELYGLLVEDSIICMSYQYVVTKDHSSGKWIVIQKSDPLGNEFNFITDGKRKLLDKKTDDGKTAILNRIEHAVGPKPPSEFDPTKMPAAFKMNEHQETKLKLFSHDSWVQIGRSRPPAENAHLGLPSAWKRKRIHPMTEIVIPKRQLSRSELLKWVEDKVGMR